MIKADDLRDITLYHDWSEEDLAQHIKELRALLDKKRGDASLPQKQDMKKLLDPGSENFMGSGMSLADFVAAGMLRDFERSYVVQDPKERKRRLKFVIAMAIELGKIRETTRFSTGLAEAAIEDVIKGDWHMVREWTKHFSFADEDASTRARYEPLFAQFVALCHEAFNTRPGVEALAPTVKH